MPLFLCRWPNGDCSAVLARNEQDALIKLDEVANAEGCPLVRLDDFQVHFHLTDDGELTLESLGEVTEDALWEFCYPVLDGVVPDEAPEHWSAQQREAVRQACSKNEPASIPRRWRSRKQHSVATSRTSWALPRSSWMRLCAKVARRPSASSSGLASRTD